MSKKTNPENRCYTVIVRYQATGNEEKSKTFPVLRSPIAAKRKALAEGKRLMKLYDTFNYSLCCIVSTGDDSENFLYLDKDGNEDTIFIDWLE